MHRCFFWALLAISSFLGGIRGYAYGQDLSSSRSPGVIHFDLTSGFLVVVEGGVGNLEGLKFIVDTGSTWSAIDRKVADRLRLHRRAGNVMSFDRYIPIEWTNITNLRIGSLRAERMRLMVVNLAEYSEFGQHVDGIIGLDLLSRCRKFIIDYAEKRFYFEPAGTEAIHPSNGFLASIVIQGFRVRLCVDTGLSEILIYHDRLKNGPVKIQTEGKASLVKIGRITGTQVTLAGVRMGGPEEVITAVLIDEPHGQAMSNFDGYLGVASLHAKRVEFDFEKMVLRFQ